LVITAKLDGKTGIEVINGIKSKKNSASSILELERSLSIAILSL
jgi:hypothetical protein